MMTRNGVVDFRTIDRPTFDLAKRRKQLEKLVAPYVTSKNTGRIIAFKGKRRYLSGDVPSGQMFAVLALQSLYRIAEAMAARDAEQTLRATLAFAEYDREIENRELFKSDSVDAMAFALGRRIEKPAAMRRRKAELADDNTTSNREQALAAIEWARQQYPTAAADNSVDFLKGKAAEHLDICKRTLNRWLERRQ